MTTRARIEEAIEGGEVLTIRYHGGSSPGATRQIAPIRFKDNNVVQARCYTSKSVKPFFIDKIEVLPPQPAETLTWEKQPAGTARKRQREAKEAFRLEQSTVTLQTDHGPVQLEFQTEHEMLAAGLSFLQGFSTRSAKESLLSDAPFLSSCDPPMRVERQENGGAVLMFATRMDDQWLRPIYFQLSPDRLRELADVLAEIAQG